MKILKTNDFISERVSFTPITNAELDNVQQEFEKIKNIEEIKNPTYEDICQEGNVVIIRDADKPEWKDYIPCLVLNKFLYDHDESGPLLVHLDDEVECGYNWWKAAGFEREFPKFIREWYTQIKKVFKTDIDPESIKTLNDLKRVLEPFEKFFTN